MATECNQMIALNQTMKNYNEDDLNYSTKDITNILNQFNHSLLCHKKGDDELENVYKLFGGECEIEKCNLISRHYRRTEQFQIDEQGINVKTLCVKDVFARIHCHFHLQYDVGFRLNKYEREQISKNYTTNDDDLINDDKFTMIQKILSTKHSKLQSLSIDYGNTVNNRDGGRTQKPLRMKQVVLRQALRTTLPPLCLRNKSCKLSSRGDLMNEQVFSFQA